jgi:hypothetical protein
MKKGLLIFSAFSFFYLTSCKPSAQSKLKKVDDVTISMFKDALSSHSTSPKYVVLTALNRDKHIQKQICCGSDDLNYALSFGNYNIDNKTTSILMSDKAYRIIGADKYNYTVIKRLRYRVSEETIDSMYHEHCKYGYSKLLEVYIKRYGNHYMEHILFEHLIVTYRDCESGSTVIENRYFRIIEL